MASGDKKTSDSLKHEAGQAAARGGARPAKAARPASTPVHDDDFPLLGAEEPVTPPAWQAERAELQRRLRQEQLRVAALEADKEESINQLVSRYQQKQDHLTAKNNEFMVRFKHLSGENESLRTQVDKLHRLEARREEHRLQEARMADGVAAQQAEAQRQQEQLREAELLAREEQLAKLHRMDLKRRLEKERALHDAELARALAALKEEENQRTLQLLGKQEQAFRARTASAAEQQRQELDRKRTEDAARHQEQLDAVLADLHDLEQAREQQQKDMQQQLDAQAAATQAAVDTLLAELVGLHMSFVVYHAGLGNITLPAQDLPLYLQNPIAYAAGKCMVTEASYRSWLEQSSNPRCTASIGEGRLCEARLIRIDSPTKFVPGQSDRCSRHQSSDAAINNVLRFQ
jgi:hypothetical protein